MPRVLQRSIFEEYIASVKYYIRTFISLLDDEITNRNCCTDSPPGEVYFICLFNGDEKRVFLTIQLKYDDTVIWENRSQRMVKAL